MEDVKQKIKENRVMFKKDIEPELKSIIFQMLQMIPKTRPSVSEVLRNPFIRKVRDQMDDSFFAAKPPNQQTKKVSQQPSLDMANLFKKKGNPKSQDVQKKNFLLFQNKGRPAKKGHSSDVKATPSKGVPKMGRNLSKQLFNLKSSSQLGLGSKFVPSRNAKIFNSSKQIVMSSHEKTSHRLNQSEGNLGPVWNGQNWSQVEQSFQGKALLSRPGQVFKLVQNPKFRNLMFCKTDPAGGKRLQPQSGGVQLQADSEKNHFSKKKKNPKVEVIQATENLNDSVRLFKQKAERDSKRKRKFHELMLQGKPRKVQKHSDSSKENKDESADKVKTQVSSIGNLKRLLKKSREGKKEFSIHLENPTSSKMKQNYRSYNPHQSHTKQPSTGDSLLLNLHSRGVPRHEQLQKKTKFQSFVLPGRKPAPQVQYLHSGQGPPAHAKSRSFNDNTIKTKLVMTRKDSINDLKKKINNRRAAHQKLRTNSSFQLSEPPAQKEAGQLLNKRIVSRKNPSRQQLRHLLPTLKRNHSTAHALVQRQPGPLVGSVAENPPGAPIPDARKYYRKRVPVHNVFQLDPKKPGNHSLSFSQRAHTLHQKPLFLKLKGHSHRNISTNIYRVHELNTSQTNNYQSVQKHAPAFEDLLRNPYASSTGQKYSSVNGVLGNISIGETQHVFRKVEFNA